MNNMLKEEKVAIFSAFIAAGLFTIRFIIFFLPHSWQTGVADGTVPGFLLAVGEHIFMLPVIWRLPAPRWSKVLGSLWVLNDISTDTLALFGVSATVFLTERYLGHLFLAAPWFFAAGWAAQRLRIRWFGWLTGFFLALYTILFVLFQASGILLLPVAVFLPLWLLFVGLWLKQHPTIKEMKSNYIS
ncbi:MAG: hypothetical protein ACYDER_13855 [Ktedonobacteraceae bacterium]